MRLVILFLFCFVGLTNATDSYAQSAKVTMNVRNQTVEDVLRAIETVSYTHLDVYKRQASTSSTITGL